MALYRRARHTRLLVVSLVMLSLVTITVDYRGGESGPFSIAGRGALTVVGALQSGVRRVFHPVSSFVSGVARIGSLQAENEGLRRRIQELERRQSSAVSAARERDRLLAVFDLQERLELTGVAANVIGASVGNFEWSATINRGSADGVEIEMPVVTGDGLVGRVVEVAASSSKVMLVIDPRSAVAARLASSGETGLVVGQTERRDLSMDLVNDEAEVAPEEEVVTSGYQGGLYPPGIPIGHVSHAYLQPGGLVPRLDVRPAVDFSTLEFVLVVTGGGSRTAGEGG